MTNPTDEQRFLVEACQYLDSAHSVESIMDADPEVQRLISYADAFRAAWRKERKYLDWMQSDPKHAVNLIDDEIVFTENPRRLRELLDIDMARHGLSTPHADPEK
jgi:hypothetical protein